MFDRLSRSWNLVKVSWAVLRQDQQLLLFPLISAAATVLVFASFALPMLGLGLFEGAFRGGHRALPLATLVLGFLFYVSLYFVIFFFNAALVGAAMIRLDGGTPTVGDGLRIANSRFWSILGYAAMAATVGIVLRAIQERVGFIGRIIVGMLGMGWTVATYLVVPILVSRDVGPFDAVSESASILKKTWGENVIGQAGVSAAFGFIHMLVIFLGVVLVLAVATTGSVALIGIAVFLALTALALTALVHAALGGIYSAALYRYASQGLASDGFDNSDMQMAFAAKR